MFDFIKNISPTEYAIILIILLLLFGGKVIKNLAKTSGETVKELKKIRKEFDQAIGIEDEKPSKN